MKSISKIIFAVMLSSICNSCSEEDYEKVIENQTEVQKTNTSFDIKEIRDAHDDELKLISNFTAQSNVKNKTSLNENITFEHVEVVNYTHLPGKAMVLHYKNEHQKSKSKKALILVASDENEMITHYEHEKTDHGNSYTVKTYKEGEPWFIAEVDKDTAEIMSFNFSSNTSAKMSFWECAEVAVGACVNDGECAFICGIIWQYCLGSIGLACAYVSL